jgi:hypothetical protein
MIITASSDTLLRQLIHQVRGEFAVKDMGPVQYFLGIHVRRTSEGFFLSQSQYAEELLDRAGMQNCKQISTPVDTKPKMSSSDGTKLPDPSTYRSLAGALQYLTMTRPELHTLSIRYACTCMIPGIVILLSSNGYSGMCVAQHTLGYSLELPPRQTSWHTRMQTGQDARTLGVPRLGTVFFSATPWCLGLESDSPQCLVLAPRPNTVALQTQLQKHAGSVNFCLNCIAPSRRLLWLIVIIFRQYTWLPIPFITDGRNMLNLTFILSEKRWPLARYGFSMIQQLNNLQMS